MRTSIKLLTLLSVIFFTSCQKEVNYATGNNQGNSNNGNGTGNTNNITGDYDFVGMTAHTESTVTSSAVGQEIKAVTVSDYITKENTGTAQITSTQFIFTNLGFSIDTTMNVKTYLDNSLYDDSNFPFVGTYPGTNSTSSYVRNSADSITVTGALGVAADPSGNTATGPVGVKLSWSGDTLLLKVNSSFTQSITQNGMPGTIVGSVTGVTKLKKH